MVAPRAAGEQAAPPRGRGRRRRLLATGACRKLVFYIVWGSRKRGDRVAPCGDGQTGAEGVEGGDLRCRGAPVCRVRVVVEPDDVVDRSGPERLVHAQVRDE